MIEQRDPRILQALAFPGTSPVYDAVHLLLEDSIESAVALALAAETQGETRVYAAGQAEALRQFRQLLEIWRAEALDRAQQGVSAGPMA